MPKQLFLPVIALLATLYSFAQAPMKVTDMLKIRTVGGITLSKDGSQAAFTLTSIEPDTDKWEYKYVNQVWTVPTNGPSVPRLLTSRENASQPAFSPDGKKIVFVRIADGKPQLFLLPLEGGEAIQLTRFRYGVSNPKWSPDGKQLVFSAAVPFKDLLKDSILNPSLSSPAWPMEKPGSTTTEFNSTVTPNPDGSPEEVRAYLSNNVADRKAKVVNKLNFQDETDVNADMSFPHIFIMDARPDAKPVAVTRGFYRFTSAIFFPDGKRLVLTGDIDSLQHPDRSLETQLYTIRTDGSQLQPLLAQEGKTFTSPVISPSGKWLAFQYGNTSFVSIPTLAFIPLDGPLHTITDIPFDRNKSNLAWSSDEKYIYFTSASNGGNPLFRAAVSTKKTEQLTDFNSGIASFALAGNTLVFAKNEVANPSELYLADAMAAKPVCISRFNSGWVKDITLSFPEKKTFVNDKGQTIEYWVMKPANYEPGKKYPLLLEIHGGPAAMWGPGESSMWHEYQYFCSKGYGVVYCNPRGSGGYGFDFLRSNISDWGAGPASDVLTALDKAVAEGWADTSKLLVTGGSYAGYLVAWIIAHNQRFKAACSQRGVYDLATFFGEGNAWRLVPNYFGGYPWETATRQVLERESPINYVHQIKTPYIIFHGENDRRTGVIQSEMMYRSLKALNRPVEYVRHPFASHEITRSGNNRQRIDQMLRTWEFFERWIGKAAGD